MITKFFRRPKLQYKVKIVRTLITNVYVLFWIIKRLKAGYSPIIGICGDQRDGKSWFAMWFVFMILAVFGKVFDSKKHLIYSPKDIDEKLAGIKEDVVLFDEAAYSYYKRLWYRTPNTSLSKIIFVQGRRTRAYIFISPFINDIDKAFTKHFDVIIDVQRRGITKTYKMKKKHMAFTDRENYPVWKGDVLLDTRNMPKEFIKVLAEYKEESERMKDELEHEDREETEKREPTAKEILRKV